MRLALIFTLVSFSVQAGWYQASDGVYYYTGGNTQTLRAQYEKNNKKNKGTAAYEKGLAKFLINKTKEDMLKSAPDGIDKNSKFSYDKTKGFSLSVIEEKSKPPKKKSKKLARSKKASRGPERKPSSARNLVSGGGQRQCQEVLTNIYEDYKDSMDLLKQMYLDELEEEGCEIPEEEIGELLDSDSNTDMQ